MSSEKEWLTFHNEYRSRHGSQSLQWSSELANSALEWATKLESERRVYHSSISGEGENLYYDVDGSSIPIAIRQWYDEVEYCEDLPGCESSNTQGVSVGHFRTMIWKSATHLGCAIVNTHAVCRYSSDLDDTCAIPNSMCFCPRNCFEENVPPLGGFNTSCTRKYNELERHIYIPSNDNLISDYFCTCFYASVTLSNRSEISLFYEGSKNIDIDDPWGSAYEAICSEIDCSRLSCAQNYPFEYLRSHVQHLTFHYLASFIIFFIIYV